MSGGYTRYLKLDERDAKQTCPECGVVFGGKSKPSRPDLLYLTRFCSRRCSRRARMHPPPRAVCYTCGQPFDARTGENFRKYCSKTCQYQARRKAVIIKKNGYPCFWTGKAEVLVHRIIMAKKLGRDLTETETVHHVDGDKMNWSEENLELWDHGQPHGQRVVDKIAWCVAFLKLHHVLPEDFVHESYLAPARAPRPWPLTTS